MYIGTKEIESQNGCEVTFKDGSTETFTEKQLQYIITEDPKSPSDYQNLCANEIVKDMLQIIDDHDMRQGDLQYVVQKFIYSYNDTFDRLCAKVFTGKDELSDIKVSDIKKVQKNLSLK